MFTYTIVLDPDLEDGGFTVTVPVLPGCVTQGDSVEQCRSRAEEAIAVHLEGLRVVGEPIPVEHDHPQLLTVSVGA